MTPRPIRGIVIKQDRQIGATLITGSRDRTPLIAIGQFTRGGDAAKVYYDSYFYPVEKYGRDYISFKIDRQAAYPIEAADPDCDKIIYGKIVNRAEHGTAGSETKRMHGIEAEVDNRGIIAEIRGLRTYVRNRTGGLAGLYGVSAEIKQDVGIVSAGIPDTVFIGDFRMDFQANAPAQSGGIRITQATDGVYTEPTAAMLVRNEARSACKGFKSLIDYEDDALTSSGRSGVVVAEDGDAVLIITAGAPSDGDYNAVAKKGCLLIDTTNARLYMNVGTKASTDWDYVSATWT